MSSAPVRQQPVTPETEAAGRQWQDRWASGPSRTRWTSLPVQAGDQAPVLELVDARLGRARGCRRRGPRVRRSCCSGATSAAAAAVTARRAYRGAPRVSRGRRHRHPDRAGRAGAHARVRRGERDPDEVRLLCDPEERAYEAYGLLEGTPVEVLFDAPDEYLRCHIDAGRSLFETRESAGRPMVDNPWLLPGEFVVARDGSLVTTYRFQFCEHWIDPRVNVAAIRSATGEVRASFAG